MSIVLPTLPLQKKQKLHMDEEGGGGVREARTTETGTPVRYLPLESVYAATETGTSGSSMSKKIKARKLFPRDSTTTTTPFPLSNNPSIRFVYALRSNKVQSPCLSYFDTLLERFGSQFNAPIPQFETPSPQFETPDKKARALEDPAGKAVGLEEITAIGSKKQKRNSELLKLGVDSELSLLDFSLPPRRRSSTVDGSGSVKATEKTRKRKDSSPRVHQDPDLLNAAASVSDDASLKTKKWVELSFEDVDPNTFVGLECKVFWPLDDDWYTGSVIRYDSEMHKHHVQYTDGDSESLILSKENIKFYLSREEMQQLNLRYAPSNKDDIGLDFGEMLVLAASCDDSDELEPGDIVWAKLTGKLTLQSDVYAFGVVLLELLTGRRGLDLNRGPTDQNLVLKVKHILNDVKKLRKVIDPEMSWSSYVESISMFANLASCCVRSESNERPSIAVQARKSRDKFIDQGLSGYAVWPAVVLNESDIGVRKGLKPNQGGRSVPVQFFGTYDFARINVKQVISFLKGLLASYHLKCKQSRFRRSLEEAKMYLSEQKLPNRMLQLQNGTGAEDSGSEDEGSDCCGEDLTRNESAREQCINTCPFEVGNLRVVSLGRVVSEYFHDERYIWPEGYAAVRKFISVTDPSVNALYKMEVLRDPDSKFRPLFRVTTDNGDQFQGSNPAACWNKIYRRIRKLQSTTANGCHAVDGLNKIGKSGSYMFGFSNPKVLKLIQDLSLYSGMPSMYSGCKGGSKKGCELTAGYRPVRVEWKDLDKCNVCYMDEEYANNLFLQCDKCRMMVHARCYGELEPVNEVLWLCNLCRLGALESPPPCCLCPVIGGAMKPTTNGLWAHLSCAIWIPETCFLDIKRMEPIDGLNRISKNRWKLLCSICGVLYGACIQCSNNTCRVAYHPLCARAAGLCVELEDEDRLHLMSFDEDEEDQCIRLLSFCKKHRLPSKERPAGEHVGRVARCCSNYSPSLNPSGCARTEPYDFVGRRGRKEPEALAAASLKRLYVENRPYLVTGYHQNGTMENELGLSKSLTSFRKSNLSPLETSKTLLSMAEKYDYMRQTFRKRLAFGKSGIHGFGIFAKLPHRAGDMMIEYSGEVVRPSIADRREHFIYNSLVGAGTYMFRIDDEHVIDATRAGSIAHLINHSCEPNCYSRVISVHGDEHIIIFAKRDINKWEELTYDYRFSSVDEQLACYCGFPRCRGVVNDIDSKEQAAKLRVPRSKLINWTSTSLQID